MARIYFTEGEKQLEAIMRYLHDEQRVRGITVFRGISGFGSLGSLHSSSLTSVLFEMPLVIEFFDEASKVKRIINELNKNIQPGHIVSWPVTVNE